MKQENYKAIAEIIKKQINDISDYYIRDSFKEFNFSYKRLKKTSYLLADYFEKENPPFKQHFKSYGFQKKQFLKDCGVK